MGSFCVALRGAIWKVMVIMTCPDVICEQESTVLFGVALLLFSGI